MFLFKQGGHFKKHTEKKKGIFGTLVIQLPSIYTGGELIVYDVNGSEYKYDFGQAKGKSSELFHYAAHYADIEHEIREITSGYRIFLVYNLCWENENGHCLNTNDAETVSSLASSLSILNESLVPLAFILDHKYTDESFQNNGIKALKKSDRQRYNLLKNASDQLPEDKKLNFYVMSAHLKVVHADNNPRRFQALSHKEPKKPKKRADSESDDENSMNHPYHQRCHHKLHQSHQLEHVFDSNGRSYNDLKFGFNFLTEIIDLKQRADVKTNINDKDVWGKYVSVEEERYSFENFFKPANISTTYRKYFLMILPKSKEVQLAFGLSLELGADTVLDKWGVVSNEKHTFVEYFKYLLKLISASSHEGRNLIRDDQVSKILEILVQLNDVSLARFYVDQCLTVFNANHCASMAYLVKQFEAQKSSFFNKEFFKPNNRQIVSVNCQLVQVSINFILVIQKLVWCI